MHLKKTPVPNLDLSHENRTIWWVSHLDGWLLRAQRYFSDSSFTASNTLKPWVDFFFSSNSKVFFVWACSRSNCSYRLLSHPVSAYKNVVSMLYSNRKASKQVTTSQHSFQSFFGFESINGVSFRPQHI